MVLTVALSVAAGMAFRRSFRGASILFYTAIASLIMPSIITSLGIALEFRLLDDFIIKHGKDVGLGAWAQGQGKSRWGEKTPGTYRYLPDVNDWFPECQVLHIAETSGTASVMSPAKVAAVSNSSRRSPSWSTSVR